MTNPRKRSVKTKLRAVKKPSRSPLPVDDDRSTELSSKSTGSQVNVVKARSERAVLPDREALVVAVVPAGRRLAGHYVGVVSLAGSLLVAAVIAIAGNHLAGPHTGRWPGFALMVAVVALICWWTRPLLGIFPAVIGGLVFDGFVTDRLGQLTWHGAADVTRVLLLLGVGLAASSGHSGLARYRRRVLIQEFTMEESNPCRHEVPAAASGADDDRH